MRAGQSTMSKPSRPKRFPRAEISECPDTTDLVQILQWLCTQVVSLRADLESVREGCERACSTEEQGFLDAKAAAAYCGMSRGTFDKYRYNTEVRIRGYHLDGKVLYKREDLDSFIKLYEIRSRTAG